MNNYMLNFLGKDSGFGNKNTSAYVENNDTLYLIDCGYTVFNEIKNKFDFEKYKDINVIITHLHNDHAGSLSQLILFLYFEKNVKINLISKCENIINYLNICGTPKDSYNLKNLDNIEFIKTDHTPFLDAYGFTMKIGNKKILYTGDTKTIDPYLNYMDNVDELYIDLSKNGGAHIKVDNVIDVLKDLNKRGILIIPMHMDDKDYINKVGNGIINNEKNLDNYNQFRSTYKFDQKGFETLDEKETEEFEI